MRINITRRDVLKSMGAAGLGLFAGCRTGGKWTDATDSGRWYRGNLHMHSYWSDGRAFPEQAINIYKQLGYDFISLTDHNLFATDTSFWKNVEEKEKGWPPSVTPPVFDAYKAEFGDEVETRAVDGKTQVRLKTYEEMRTKFDEKGKFLLMPGVEITQVLNGINVHMNYINLPDAVSSVKGGPLSKKYEDENLSSSELIGHNVAEVTQMASGMKRPSLLTLNHPHWVYWDITPQNLIDNPAVRFFEVCNGGSSFAPHPDAMSVTNDSFWDAVNAFRCLKGDPLLYGIGTDDTHIYLNRNSSHTLGDAWIMVRSMDLTPGSLIQAMHAGDFYASTGVLLKDLEYNQKNRKLSVKVNGDTGVKYRIHFITTKRGFDQTVRIVDAPAEKGRGDRKIPVYSADIGKTVKVVNGTEGSYTMQSDDLYVRARIESDITSSYKKHFHPDVQVAWTQPYR